MRRRMQYPFAPPCNEVHGCPPQNPYIEEQMMMHLPLSDRSISNLQIADLSESRHILLNAGPWPKARVDQDTRSRIIDACQQNPSLSMVKIAAMVGVSNTTVSRWIARHRMNGHVKKQAF